MRTSTLMFAIRWYFVPFVGGLLLAIFSVNGMYQWKPDPIDVPFQSVVGKFGFPLLWVGLVVGVIMAVYGWHSAAKLRRG